MIFPTDLRTPCTLGSFTPSMTLIIFVAKVIPYHWRLRYPTAWNVRQFGYLGIPTGLTLIGSRSSTMTFDTEHFYSFIRRLSEAQFRTGILPG